MKLSPRIIVPVLNVAYRLWSATLRVKQYNREQVEELNNQKQPFIFSVWHGEVFPSLTLRGNLKVCVLTSLSRDGEIMTGVLRSCGFHVTRGSSSRGGGPAIKNILRMMLEEKHNVCISPDGPRGPIFKVKKGVIFLAAHASAPIIPVRIFFRKAKRFKSWDRYALPFPFSKVEVRFGEPYYLPAHELTDTEIDEQCLILQHKMETLQPSPGYNA